jgi:hypothetical protein
MESQMLSTRQLFERTYEQEYFSEALGKPHRFSFIVPKHGMESGTGSAETTLPILLCLHGLGRDHLTVVNNDLLREAFSSSGYLCVFPCG